MIEGQRGDQLVRELLAKPQEFNAQGRAYDLLQEYFSGYSLETLRPLLSNSDKLVQRAAVWVAAELGEQACRLIDDAIPLVHSEDRHLQYHALQIVVVCAVGANVDAFVHLVRSLESDDDVIRILAMRLVSNADASQLEAGHRLFASSGYSDYIHKKGLLHLLDGDQMEPQRTAQMIADENSLVRSYGAIAAKRLFATYPELIARAEGSADHVIRKFAREVVEDGAP